MSVAQGGLAVAASLALHLGAALALVPWLAPRPVPQQGGGDARVMLATMAVPRDRAMPQEPEAEQAARAEASGARMAGQGVPVRRAPAQSPNAEAVAALPTSGAVLSARSNPVAPVAALRPEAATTAALAPSAARAGEVRAQPVKAIAAQPDQRRAMAADDAVQASVARVVAARIVPAAKPAIAARQDTAEAVPAQPVKAMSVAAVGAVLSARLADAAPITADVPSAARVRAEPTPPPVAAETPVGADAAAMALAPVPLSARAPQARQASALASGGAVVTAGLAWSGAGRVSLDAQSLATLEAFLLPGQAAGQEQRDRMAAAMAAPDCARVHTVFDPDTGALELRGHVPEAAARAPLLETLQAQVGTALPLRNALQILPRPQCALLDGIAAMGLPQSEEQLTDSDLVGEHAQVREYAFDEGDRLTIDLTAPDYPAYVYVDYFDASGQVLHLVPNARRPLRRLAPAETVSVGRGDDLDLRIAPPFGQDIAVAFATSQPLYEGDRPLVEKALPYLSEMQARIAAARAADSAFRGEWVYLFVTTGPAPP